MAKKVLKPSFKEQYWLDVGCGVTKIENCIGMDKQKLPGVDVVHDAEVFPWPFKDNQFDRIYMAHLMEHLKPWLAVDLMNEMWRVMKVNGVLAMAMPYPGSVGHWQDPTHIRPWSEHTPKYFDPDFSELYNFYTPKPWKIDGVVWRSDGNIEIAMRKRDINFKVTK